ncbi:MAG: SpoIID/LytB domain-containing protein, partial [Halanaerobium sp.]
MKKVFRLIIISALLLGIFIPLMDHYYNQSKPSSVTMAQKSRDRTIRELFKLAEESFYEGNYNSAEEYYRQVIELAPYNLESRRNLAVIYNDQNDLKSENEILLQTAILSGENQDYLNLAVNFYEIDNNLASNFILENKIDEAEAEDVDFLFQKLYYLIKNHLELENYQAAEEYLMEITSLELNKAEVYLLSAELNKKKGNFMQAFQNYQKSYQAQRSQSYLFKDMAQMLEKAEEERRAYNYWQNTLDYGWFEKLAYQRIKYYQDKYPELKAEEIEENDPEEINPFTLKASWQEIEKLPTEKDIQSLRIGLQENNEHLLFQYSDPFSIIYDGIILFRGDAKKNYMIEVEGNDIYIKTEEEKVKLGSSDLEYQIYSSHENSSFYVFNINYGQGYFWQGSGNRQYRGNMIIKGEGEEFTLINQVDLTPYLLSVVPSEIYASWPMESLKAQAVAARSYT